MNGELEASQPPALRAGLPWPERIYQAVLGATLFLLGFFVLYAPAGIGITVPVLALLGAAAPVRLWRTRPWRDPVLAIGLVLFAYIALRTFIGEGLDLPSVHAINKYHELLFAPLMYGLLRIARRPQAFSIGLIAGALLLAGLYWTGLPRTNPLGQSLHLHRISASFGLAVCAYLLFEHGRLGKLPRVASYAAAAFLALTVLGRIDARTGHVVLLLLVLVAAFRAAPARVRLYAVAGVLLLGLAAGALSPSVRNRVMETLHDSEAESRGLAVKDSSTQQRLEIWENAITVTRENWVLGTGLKGYLPAVEAVSRRRHPDPSAVPGARSTNPHNEYLMQLSALGLPALLLFLLWLGWPIARTVREAGTGRPWSGVVGCVALAFAVGCLFNSLLLDFIEGHFYAAVLAWLLVRRAED